MSTKSPTFDSTALMAPANSPTAPNDSTLARAPARRYHRHMIRQINVRELHRRLEAGEPTYLIDVRQPWEHEAAALPDQLLLPLDQMADRIDEVQPPEGALVVAYCHHGIRSLNAAALLAQAGIEAVSLAGGIDLWSLQVDAKVPRY